MKTVTLTIAAFILCSFTRIDNFERPKSAFYASINNEMFRTTASPTLQLNEPGTAYIGPTKASILKINFPGPQYQSREGQPFAENLQLMLGYTEEGLDTNYYVLLHYQLDYYYVVKEKSKLDITSFQLNADKSVNLSATFNCTMRSYSNVRKTIQLTGRIDNVTIAAPALTANAE